jgi:hypothetical protein
MVGPLAVVATAEELVRSQIIDTEEMRHSVGLSVAGPDTSGTAALPPALAALDVRSDRAVLVEARQHASTPLRRPDSAAA